jgi:putative transposase
VINTYKYRVFTSRAQSKSLNRLLDEARGLYNGALAERREAWEGDGGIVTFAQQLARYRSGRPYDFDASRLLKPDCVQRVLRRVDRAFSDFRRRHTRDTTAGFPRFKGRNRFRSIEFRRGDGCEFRVEGRGRARLVIEGVGPVRVKLHRLLPAGSRVTIVQLRRMLDKWYVNLTTFLPDQPRAARSKSAVGIDIGLASLLALSSGETVENPRWLGSSLAELRRAQRRFSRRRLGSSGWHRAGFTVARLHHRISNQRRDFWHKKTRELVQRFGLIAIEDLSLSFLTRDPRRARSAHDAGLGMFRTMLLQKAARAAVRVVAVDARGTSQLCSACGATVWKELSVRVHRCRCGLVLDRDVNAARNILMRATGSGVSLEAKTWPDTASVASDADQR